MQEHYLDNSATTMVDPQVAEHICKIMTEDYGNPSSLHRKGFRAQLELDNARKSLAEILDCRSDEIIFTGSGSESNNLAILGSAYANSRRKGSMVVSSAEHSSVLGAFRFLESKGWQVIYIPPLPDGSPDSAAIAAAVTEETLLVSAMLVGSETGSICDIRALAAAVKAKNPRTLVHCDAVQGFGRLPVYPSLWGIDILSASAHKINGPKGIGLLYLKKGLRISPLYYGGGQEMALRPGTENVPSACGFALAASLIWEKRRSLNQHWKELRDLLIKELSKVEGMCINSPKLGAPYILNISLTGLRSETIIHFLEEKGIYVSSGSACSKGAKSHVLVSMGLDDRKIDSALRISMGKFTTARDIQALVTGLAQARSSLASREDRG